MDASAGNSASHRTDASDGGGTQDHVVPNDVVATYPDVESARAAIVLLERHGVEGGDIELVVPTAEPRPLTNEAQRDADMQATGQVGKRAAAGVVGGAVAGAVVGAILGAVVSIAFDIYAPIPLAIGGALALGAAGWQLGFFYGGATGLPVTESWGESYNAESSGETGEPRLAVHNRQPDDVAEVVQALKGTGALTLRKADGEGHLVDA